jgi:hypothetical protein
LAIFDNARVLPAASNSSMKAASTPSHLVLPNPARAMNPAMPNN